MTLNLLTFYIINHIVATSAETFYCALEQSDLYPWPLAAATLVGMWFVSQPEVTASTLRDRYYSESRRNTLLVFIALILSFFIAKTLGAFFDSPRPFVVVQDMDVPIDYHVWDLIKNSMKRYGSFPSDHAAMFAVITVGVFSVHRKAGWCALVIACYFALLRIGVGFHWPKDMLVGALIGIAIAVFLLKIKPKLCRFIDPCLRFATERHPALFYPVAFFFLLDMAKRFIVLFHIIKEVREAINKFLFFVI